MTEIRLTRLQIRNFKGIRELDIAFDGQDMNVLGDNGTGKTSIIDSFTWLLFGKDSLGRADFGIKPTDGEGNIVHHLETSVEAVFNISGTETVFMKTLSEVWTRKRGAAEAEFTRNENGFYIDGVPKKKTEYTAAIKELIDEEVFKIITNPLYFNESVNWKDRRSVLLTICGEVSDEEVVASNPELATLLPLLQGKSVSDFKEITAQAMRRINQELDMIPVKINEAERAKPNADALVIDLARKETILQEIESLREKRFDALNGAEAAQARQKIKMLRQELSTVNSRISLANDHNGDKEFNLSVRYRDNKRRLEENEIYKKRLLERKEEKNRTRAELSEKWDKVFAERFTSNMCPTCGRELPADEVEAKTMEFNRNKALRLDGIEKENEKTALEIRDLESQIEALTEASVGFAESMKSTQEELERVKAEYEARLEVVKEEAKNEERRIEQEISEAESLLQDYEAGAGETVSKIDAQIATLTSELNAINEVIANNALLEKQNIRIAELREQQTKLASEYTKQERNLYLAEQFVVAKVYMLNERINRKFKYAKFKLFEKQINGGINEVCEVTYNGIPYKDLNNAMRINIGLDVINTISAHYGTACPIMIDNCESVNDLFHTEAQQIRFYVSHDKALRFEGGAR